LIAQLPPHLDMVSDFKPESEDKDSSRAIALTSGAVGGSVTFAAIGSLVVAAWLCHNRTHSSATAQEMIHEDNLGREENDEEAMLDEQASEWSDSDSTNMSVGWSRDGGHGLEDLCMNFEREESFMYENPQGNLRKMTICADVLVNEIASG
jgi:hypothetical protein